MLSVVVPAYNEEKRLEEGLDRMMAYLSRRGRPFEILVVDDGSLDATRQIAERRAAAEPRIRCISLPRNQGKGAAVARGMLSARGDWILCTDVDLSTPIEEVERLEALRDGADVVIGSRGMPDTVLSVRQPRRRENLGGFFNLVVRIAAIRGLFDTQCGFKLWSREAARASFSRLRILRFAFDVESLWLCRKRGFRIQEVGVRWSHDERSTVSLYRDGLRMGADLVRILLRRTLGD